MSDKIVPGKYKHFKGNFYRVFCVATDMDENQYVLYQQEYGNHAYWLRPASMFLEEVDSGEQRFQLIGEEIDLSESVKELACILEKECIVLMHSETSDLYCITSISTDVVMVWPKQKRQNTGYLTDYYLAERMGYNICKIYNKIRVLKTDDYTPKYRLLIGDNKKDTVENLFNPCSVDLQIAESGFLYTKHKKIDISSINHPANATELWKTVKPRLNKDGESYYIELKPHQTLITHTKELLTIPDDCAGKIEIKSTYARLSLSVTMGDFCNPGYRGYFPLEISNHGNHTIMIAPGEVMAQLKLIPLSGPVLNYYSSSGTFTNEKGYDDGDPYNFYRERSIKAIRKEKRRQPIIDAYEAIMDEIPHLNVGNKSVYKKRFDNSFLKYCQKTLIKDKYQDRNGKPDLGKLIYGYIKREQFIQRLWSLSLPSGICSLIITALAWMFAGFWQGKVSKSIIIALSIVLVIFGVISIVMHFKKPEEFCTLGQINIEELISKIEKKNAANPDEKDT